MSDSNLDESSDLKPTLPKSNPNVIFDEIVLNDNSDEESQSSVTNNNCDSEEVPVSSQCHGNNGRVVDTFTLSSDEEDVDYSVSDVPVKSEADSDPLKEQIDQFIDALVSSRKDEEFGERCKKIEDSFDLLEKEISNIIEQCQLLKESSEKYSYPETHITGDGYIDPGDNTLNIQESVQRIVQIDSIKRKIVKDVPIESGDAKINLGSIKKAIEELKPAPAPKLALEPEPEIDIVNITTLEDLQKLYKLPKHGPIVRKPLAIGDQVYAVTDPKNMAKSLWQPATIIETCKMSGKIHYNVTFEDSFIPCIFLKGTQLAYRQTPSVMLPNRSRVIAQYPNESSPTLGESNRLLLFSGLIAEVARRTNLFRYLVFFDNGLVAYVPCDSVFLIAEENLSLLDDVPEERKPFLKKYFTDYPERALVKYQPGEKDFVDVDGKWVPGRVKQVDCSLVRFYFRQFEKYEWLYRGSPRLKPLSSLFKTLINPEAEAVSKKRVSRKGTSQSLTLGYKKRPFVQFIRDEDSATDEDEKKYPTRSGAKRLDTFDSNDQTVFDLYPEFITKPSRYLVSSPHVPHRCSPNCVNISYEDISRYRDTNPYAIPIICGWDRQVAIHTDAKNKRKRTIFYVSPCGRRFRSIEEVDIFLSITKSKLPIDLFTYHSKLVLYSELDGKTSQGCYYYDADVARGTENHSISCINWVNDEPITPGFQYWPARFPGNGVSLELDPHFLICCDCTDNCRDKSKCECQQLTKDSFEICRSVFNLEDDNYGYSHRRLYEACSTGIWECNSNCACNVNCANRVVQNGIRVRLQIFKTKKKGWGIRCLHDIPRGAFICIYAAELLNEELADQHGADFGDEYLADLDYIETVEKFKEGFEEAPFVELSSDEESISPSTSDQESDNYHHKSRGRRKTSRRKGSNKKSKKNPKRIKKVKKSGKPVRELYGENSAYSLDAKRKGNVGRYFNHSCDPNCFVQNVFIDTHDLRFPWVALFSSKFVPAFTELCWDYNYEIIEGRKMWCHCGASNCRGRLL